jgi:hypothetical protein
MRGSLLKVLLLPAAAFVIAGLLSRELPKAQTVHYVLGDAAPRVEEVDARWTDNRDTEMRGATFHYAQGQAPRVITHEPRLPDGDYDVQVAVVGRNERQTIRQHVVLGGGVTNIQLDRSVLR